MVVVANLFDVCVCDFVCVCAFMFSFLLFFVWGGYVVSFILFTYKQWKKANSKRRVSK